MDSLAANPLHLRPCLGFYCLQLLLFSNLFWSDVFCKIMFLGNKSTWISEIWYDRTVLALKILPQEWYMVIIQFPNNKETCGV